MDRRTGRPVALACAAAAFVCGCGYRAGFTMPKGIETIHVEVFENKTFFRGVDFELTQAVKREILARTDLTVARKEDADVVLSCSLDSVSDSVLREKNDVVQESDITVKVSATAKDRLDNVIFQSRVKRSVRFVVLLGEDDKTARVRAMRQVAEELVYRLAEAWGWRDDRKPAAGDARGRRAGVEEDGEDAEEIYWEDPEETLWEDEDAGETGWGAEGEWTRE